MATPDTTLRSKRTPLSRLKVNPENPRTIRPKRMEDLKRTMQADPEMLNARPLVALPDGTVILGNHRLMAAQELGWTDIPVITVDLDESRAVEWALRDNISFAEDEDEAVAALLQRLADAERDTSLVGYPAEYRDGLMRLLDFRPHTKPVNRVENPKSVRGEVYELGPHRLLCGDATSAEDAALLTGGEVPPMLFTSPPYADLREYDSDSGIDLSPDFLAGFIDAWDEYCGAMVVNLGLVIRKHAIVPYWDTYLAHAARVGREITAWNVWDRGSATNIAHNSVAFPTYHEWVFVFGKGKVETRRTVRTGGKKVTSRVTQRERDGSLSQKTKGAIHSHKPIGSVLRLNQETAPYGDHPAAFPPELPAEYMRALTEPGDWVVDPFAGSGTTMIAAEHAERRCLMVEIDPGYCDVIRHRYADYTAQPEYAP